MNYFQLFQLPAQFELDLTELGTRYLTLQKQFHPDNFAAASSGIGCWRCSRPPISMMVITV